jgi:hypothetical protein
MKTMSLLLLGLLLLLMFGLPGASTITLTGSCPSVVFPNSGGYLYFTLLNSGNGAAGSLIISPVFAGANVSSSTYSINSLNPGANYTFNISIDRTDINGTFAGYFIVEYQQSSSTQFATFPCDFSVGKRSNSTISITSLSNNGKELSATLYNMGSSQIAANLSIVAPPQFSISPQSVEVTIKSNSQIRQQFDITEPQTNGTFAIIGIVSYLSGNTHYSSFYASSIETSATANQQTGIASSLAQNLPIVIVAIAILVILSLIVLSIVRKRKKEKHKR